VPERAKVAVSSPAPQLATAPAPTITPTAPALAPRTAVPKPSVDPLLELPEDDEVHGFDDIDISNIEPVHADHQPETVVPEAPAPTSDETIELHDNSEPAAPAYLEIDETAAEEAREEVSEAQRAFDDAPDYSAPIAAKHPTSREDIMSGADMTMPDHDHDAERRPVVSHHRKHRLRWWQWLLIIFFIIVLAGTAFNFLLDAELISTDGIGFDIPHTNLL
jgi:hypothetical protein